MSFLISGTPRSRTAWLTALINAHGTRCWHDIYPQGIPDNGTCNVCDPAVALLHPQAVQDFDVTISVWRDLDDSRFALERWAGYQVDDKKWRKMRRNATLYVSYAQHCYQVEDLEDAAAVGEIIKLCTNKAASSELIQIFQLLRIEEHLEKARSQFGSPM